ncbi:glycosyltransferase family 9 protein [bacterium SCSIO 12741]|nr:glycosyltransferase family 9 protein [bacterium SCSIO 12741]
MKKPNRIIISRTDSIGDVMLTLPMAGWAKKHWPEAEVIFIGKTYTRDVVSCCQFVDRFIDVSNWEQKGVQGCSVELKALQADIIFFALPNKFLARAAKRAGISKRVGVSRRWFHKIYCNVRPTFSRRKSDLHEAQLNLKLMEPFIATPIPEMSAISKLYGFVAPNNQPGTFQNQKDPSKKQIIVHPRSQGSAREWGLGNFSKLMELLPASDFQIWITGTEKEGAAIRESLPLELNQVSDVTGQMTLLELIDFIDQSDALIAASTGPLHIAAALGKATIGLYSPIRPIHPGRWAPLGKKAIALTYDGEIAKSATAKNDRSIEEITPDRVKATLLDLL